MATSKVVCSSNVQNNIGKKESIMSHDTGNPVRTCMRVTWSLILLSILLYFSILNACTFFGKVVPLFINTIGKYLLRVKI